MYTHMDMHMYMYMNVHVCLSGEFALNCVEIVLFYFDGKNNKWAKSSLFVQF